MSPAPLSAAIGRYPHTAALFADPTLRIEPFPVISRAFAPMVREQRFEVSEMAIATLLMARAARSDLKLLPVVMAARAQHGALLRRADDRFGPDALPGKLVGARAYSQTTGMWLRGMLAEEHGIAADALRWVTFEDAHVPGFRDPDCAKRAPPGSDMVAMLLDGTLDAAVFGNDVPDDPRFAPVFPDPAAAGPALVARHGVTPGHPMVGLRRHGAHRPGKVALALRYAAAQGLLARTPTLDEIWA